MERTVAAAVPRASAPVHRRRPVRSRLNRRVKLFAWLLFAPALLWVGMVTFAPILQAVEFSLFRASFLEKDEYVGLANYVDILQGPDFVPMAVRTLVYSAASLALSLVIALALAMLINHQTSGMTGIRTLLMLPWITSPLLAALLWRWAVSPLIGPISHLYSVVTGAPEVDVLATGTGAMATLIVVSVWRAYPFGMVLLLASLRTIPKEYYEAARVDGAGFWARLRHITIPALKNTLLVVTVFFSVNFLTMAELPLVLTGGGPSGSTELIGLRLYREAFDLLNTGVASALAVLLFIANAILSWIYIRALRSEDI